MTRRTRFLRLRYACILLGAEDAEDAEDYKSADTGGF